MLENVHRLRAEAAPAAASSTSASHALPQVRGSTSAAESIERGVDAAAEVQALKEDLDRRQVCDASLSDSSLARVPTGVVSCALS
jgi:hypothetical protein